MEIFIRGTKKQPTYPVVISQKRSVIASYMGLGRPKSLQLLAVRQKMGRGLSIIFCVTLHRYNDLNKKLKGLQRKGMCQLLMEEKYGLDLSTRHSTRYYNRQAQSYLSSGLSRSAGICSLLKYHTNNLHGYTMKSRSRLLNNLLKRLQPSLFNQRTKSKTS